MNDNDCRPSEAKAHIIGELNNAVSNCLKIKVDNLGNIEAGQGTFFFKKDDTTNAFEYNVFSLTCICEKMNIRTQFLLLMSRNFILIPQFKENC